MDWKKDLIILGIISPIVSVLAQKYLGNTGDQNLPVNLTSFEWIAIGISLGAMILGYLMYFKKNKKQNIQSEVNPQTSPIITLRDVKTLDWLDEVKTEVSVLAVDGGSFAESNFERIKKRINENDVSFTFLLLNSSSEILTKAEGTLLSPKAKIGIESQLERFKQIHNMLGNKTNKLEIRIYDLPVVHSMFIIDPKTDNGKMVVEYYEYKTEPRDKINIILTKKNNPKFFEFFYSKYKYVWEQSTPHNFT